jgi:hypothetical protein
MQVDIYNSARVLVGSSAAFTAAPVNTWIEVPINDVPFTGKFYAMIKFNTATAAYYLASDENGPYAAQDLGWNQSSTGVWAKASSLGSAPCVFLCRVTTLVTGDLKSVELVPGTPAPAGIRSDAKASQARVKGDSGDHTTMGPVRGSSSDSSILVGYNVYRTGDFGTPPYTKINAGPVTATTFVDPHTGYPFGGGWWKYFVTSYFKNSDDLSFLCESFSTDTVYVFLEGIGEAAGKSIQVYPNPATEIINVHSDYRINGIEVISFAGQAVYSDNCAGLKTATIGAALFAPGIYFVRVVTNEGVFTSKVAVTH